VELPTLLRPRFKGVFMQKQNKSTFWLFYILIMFLLPVTEVFSSDEGGEKWFATVDGYNISEAIYLSVLQAEAKKRYYHGRITEERLAELKKDVAQDLIDQILLIHEAERLDLTPDAEKIRLEIEAFDQRYKQDKAWQADRERVLPLLKKQFESRKLVRLLEQKIRSDFVLTEEEKRAFYQKNLELFVFPERKKVSLILKKVSPSALFEEWQAAEALLSSLAERIKAGEPFAELAKAYSDDETADQGGDMGYQHEGMLHSDVETALNALDVGQLSQPIRLLQGYVLVRKEEVIPAQQIRYEDAKEQAAQLLFRKESDLRWTNLLKKLRDSATIVRF